MRDIDQIIELTIRACPTVKVQQLKVLHPGADDDGLWFFKRADGGFEVQIESSSGMCPFLIEWDETPDRFSTTSIDETVATIVKLLRSAPSHD